MFTSNHSDSFWVEERDRRYFIYELRGDPLPDAFYKRYVQWLDHEGGAAALFYYLLNSVDTSSFNPNSAAPVTGTKRRAVEDSRTDIGAFCAALHESPDSVLRVGNAIVTQSVFTARELHGIYAAGGDTRLTINGMSRSLRAAGFNQAAQGAPVPIDETGLQGRLWIVRDRERLEKLSGAELGRLYMKEHANGNKSKF